MIPRLPVLCILLALLVGSCKSAEKAIFQLASAPISSRLPALETTLDIGPWANSQGALPEDARILFQRELRQNITIPADSVPYGFAKLVITSSIITRSALGFQAVQMVTLMLPTLVGMPVEDYTTRLHAVVQLMNARGELIGSYHGTGSSKVRVAMYYGYSQTLAPRLADVQALKQALGQIRPQIAADAARLRDDLLSTGPLEISAGP